MTGGDGVTEILEYASSDCEKLKSINIGNKVTIIRKNAFYKCGIETGTIPDRVTLLDKGVF